MELKLPNGKTIKIRIKQPTDIKLNPKNTNQGSERGNAALDESLQQTGFHRGIFTAADDVVVGGNHAFESAVRNGVVQQFIEIETEGDVGVVTKRTDWKNHRAKEARLAAIADNRVQELNYTPDPVILGEEIAEIELPAVLFTDDELQEIIGEIEQAISPEDEEESTADKIEQAERGEIESRVKPGEIWRLGRHRIACADSTVEANVRALLGERFGDVGMVFTDPPYNVSYKGKSKHEQRTTAEMQIENDSFGDSTEFYNFLLAYFSSAISACKKGAAIYVCHADTEGENFRKALRTSGWLYKQSLVWVKNSLVLGRQDYHWRHEPILYGWKPGASHSWFSDRSQTTVWEFNRPTQSREHPTMKPLELVEYALGNSSDSFSIVYDGFLGSGSTLLAAQKMAGDRTVYGFELSPEYCEVICRRFEEYTGINAELVGHIGD